MKIAKMKINFSYTGNEKKELISKIEKNYNFKSVFPNKLETITLNGYVYNFKMKVEDLRSGLVVEFINKVSSDLKVNSENESEKAHWSTEVKLIAEEKGISFADAKLIWQKSK